ncbi:outer membrane protein [Bacteriovorax sp. Seq25_V]|uniref:outer membrane protein n=1 Tax=Bacteriovorax sp. Seq25_V TaxID=1201288 RepID=UPI000389DB85|nr:outer membrane beta-barrel protein [Bacteriovorax sp. Seq25_V]EQC47296.1 outer membrane protein beta-barrel domain protein [Bacteriovorax sp. Seq25_V]
MLSTFAKSLKIMPVILITGFSFSTQAKSIKELTSSKSSEKVESEVAKVASISTSGLHVHAIGVGLGQTFLSGDFASNGEDRITPDLYYNYSASHSFDFMANFHWSSHKYKSRKTTISGLALGIKAKLFNFDNFSPFLVGGLGFYSPKMTREIEGEFKTSRSKLTFGYNLGAGADLDLNSRVKVGIIGMIHNPFDIKQDDQPEVEGSYYKLQVTAYYKF